MAGAIDTTYMNLKYENLHYIDLGALLHKFNDVIKSCKQGDMQSRIGAPSSLESPMKQFIRRFESNQNKSNQNK